MRSIIQSMSLFTILMWADLAAGQNTFPATGNAGIGTASPQGPLHILSPGPPPRALPPPQNGLLLGVDRIDGFKWIQSYGGPLVFNPVGNNVGLGNLDPTHRLDVAGEVRVRANPLTNLLIGGQGSDDVHLDLIKNTSITPAARLEFDGFTDAARHEGEIAFYTRSSADPGPQERMRIRSNGQITMGSVQASSVEAGGLSASGNSVSLTNPAFNILLTLERRAACLRNERGGITLADCLSAAEYAPTIDEGAGRPDTGDLVRLVRHGVNPASDPRAPFVLARSARSCDRDLIGVMASPEAGASGVKIDESYRPLAMYGYFPTKVTVENGPIQRGDPITSSSRPGHGMRATDACRIVGYALEDAERDGVIQVLASLGEYPGASVTALETRLRNLEARLAAMEHHAQRISPLGQDDGNRN